MTPLRKRYIEDLQLVGCAASTQRNYVGAVRQLALYYHKSPDQLSQEELRAYFLHLVQDKHYARSTFGLSLCAIRFLFRITLKRPWPSLALIRPAKHKPLPVILSQAEVRAILPCVRVPVYRSCLTTIYSCGLRISEGVGLKVGDVDAQRMVLRVRGKGNKQREIPLSPHTLESLRALWKAHRSKPWLFPAALAARSQRQDGPVGAENVQCAFRWALQQSGVTKAATVHTLRHSYATHLMEAGVALRLIQEILGHTSPRTTALYTHLTAQVRAQVNQPLEAMTRDLQKPAA